MSWRDYSAEALDYCRSVVDGRRPACRWILLACQRTLDDFAAADSGSIPYRYDRERAARVCQFVELLPHIKGEWARRRETIRLEPWQTWILTQVFGWVAEDGRRRYRSVYLEVPRKNAKSTLSAGVGLYMLAADGEAGPEIYSAATTRDQARIVWQDAWHQVKRSAGLRRAFGVDTTAHSITVVGRAGRFQPLSADSSSLDGLNVHLAILDEVHAHKTRAVYDVLETATGARAQPLLWAITTAGSNRAGIGYELRAYTLRLLQGLVDDPTWFGAVWTLDDGDDWTTPAAWEKANPNYGVSVMPDDLERLCRKAEALPSARASFLTKRLDVWVNAEEAWMDMAAWSKCGDPGQREEDYLGRACFVGLDLASKIDMAAMEILFPEPDGTYAVFGRYYLPAETVQAEGNDHYRGWAAGDRLTVTPGNVIDFSKIEADLLDLARRFDLVEVAFDPYQAVQFSTRMMEEGLPMIEVRPTVLNFSEPMKALEALALEGRLVHDEDPILEWMVSNVVCHRDNKDNIYPRKERPEQKIDGVVALLMALNRAMARGDGRSVYEERGVFLF